MMWWFAETTVTVAAIAAIAILAPRAGRVGPAARHALWLVAMVRLVTPPLVYWPRGPLPPRRPESSAPMTRPVAAGTTPSPFAPGSNAEGRMARIGLEAGPPRPTAFDAGPGGGPAPGTGRASSVASPAVVPSKTFFSGLRPGLFGLWFSGTIGVALGQAIRIVRFRRRLAAVAPPPPWLQEMLAGLSVEFGVRSPPLRMMPGIDAPLLWCLGRPVLLVPTALVDRLDAAQWVEILAHELAHLRRGDPWSARLALLAGLLWWWNPLYWFVRRRLDVEAELACDAWVLWCRPDGRRAYARTLIDVCEAMSRPVAPSPALGVSGAGPFLERRLRMIMHGQVARRMTSREVLAAGLVALLALPSWSRAERPEETKVLVRAEDLADVETGGVDRDEPEAAVPPAPRPIGVAIGSIDMDAVFKRYEKVKKVSDRFKAEANVAHARLAELNIRLKGLKERREKMVGGSPEKQELEATIKRLMSGYDAEREQAERDFARREPKELASLYKEIQEVTATVARAKGLTYVVKVSSDPVNGSDPTAVMAAMARSVVYADPSADITEDVVNSLNRQYREAVVPDQGFVPRPRGSTRRFLDTPATSYPTNYVDVITPQSSD